jgi:hypothetical protein
MVVTTVEPSESPLPAELQDALTLIEPANPIILGDGHSGACTGDRRPAGPAAWADRSSRICRRSSRRGDHPSLRPVRLPSRAVASGELTCGTSSEERGDLSAVSVWFVVRDRPVGSAQLSRAPPPHARRPDLRPAASQWRTVGMTPAFLVKLRLHASARG